MPRLLAAFITAQLGCSVVVNRVPDRTVVPGDELDCSTSKAPAVLDLGVAIAGLVPAAFVDDCGPDGCHDASEQITAGLAVLFVTLPFLISAAWGHSASSSCRSAKARARGAVTVTAVPTHVMVQW